MSLYVILASKTNKKVLEFFFKIKNASYLKNIWLIQGLIVNNITFVMRFFFFKPITFIK